MGRARRTQWVKIGDSGYEARIPAPRWWAKPAGRLVSTFGRFLPGSWHYKIASLVLSRGYRAGPGKPSES